MCADALNLEFQLTVGTLFDYDEHLEPDLALAKFALLYADKVTIFSPLLYITAAYIDLVAELGMEESGLDKNTRLALSQTGAFDLINAINQEILIVPRGNFDELKDGLLKLPIETTPLEAYESVVTQFSRAQQRNFFEEFANHVLNTPTQLIFDREASASFSQFTQADASRITNQSQSKHTALAAQVFNKLPAFATATVDEIIDIRKELAGPLIRFRSAMLEFSDGIRFEPWTKDFVRDAELVILKEVAPAVLEIDEAVRTNRYVTQLAHKIPSKPLVSAGSLVSVLLSQMSAFPDIVSHSAAFGTILGAGTIMYDAYVAWQDRQREIDQNKLLFLYQTNKRLASKHRNST